MPGTRSRPARKAAPAPARTLSPAQIASAVRRMAAPTGTDRYAAGKSLIATAERVPSRLYPHFAALAPFLKSDNKIVRWNALRILAALAPVDSQNKLAAILDVYLAYIPGPNMISAANAILGAARIAQARPELLDRILPAILQVESATYETPECRNIVIGHALNAFKQLGPDPCHRPDIHAFIQRQQSNSRPPVARRARALLAANKEIPA